MTRPGSRGYASNTPTYQSLKATLLPGCHECDERFIAHTSEFTCCHITKQVKQSILGEAADTEDFKQGSLDTVSRIILLN